MLWSYRDEIIQLTLDFRLIQSVQSFDNQLSLSCRRDTSNEVPSNVNMYDNRLLATVLNTVS